jgi:hypothetical protein
LQFSTNASRTASSETCLRRGSANPSDEIFKLQKQYSKEEIEVLIEEKPVKAKGMTSRIRGEIRLYPQ